MTWKFENCKGTLVLADSDDGQSIDIRFAVECKIDGFIDIQVQPVQWSEGTSQIDDAFHSAGAYAPRLSLTGKASDGVSLSSDKVYIVGSGFQWRKDEQTTWQLTLECSELLASISHLESSLVYDSSRLLRYDLPGFRCFNTIRGTADVGEIKAAGSTKIEDYDRITGYLAVKAERPSQIKEWLKRADEQVDLILDVFSLAGGRFLQWAGRSLFLDDVWIETLFKRPVRRGEPTLPIFHYLNMQPILDLAIGNYTKEIEHETGFGIALEQFLISSLYIESQFATSFMALEHFVNTHARKTGAHTILDDAEFAAFVIPEVREGLRRAKEAVKKDREGMGVSLVSVKKAFKAISGKIKELNRYPFVRNMWKFLDEIAVPLDGLPKDEIEKVVQTRHTLIHSGSSSPGHTETNENQRGLFLLRELLTRIFLTLLKYEGQYSSYLHGHQFTDFPPKMG